MIVSGVLLRMAYPAPPVVPLPYSVLPLYESVLPLLPKLVSEVSRPEEPVSDILLP